MRSVWCEARYPAVPVLAFGATADADALATAVAAGASGALLWDLSGRPPGDATTARVARARRWHSAGIPRQPLTERERHVLQEISNGRPNGEIAREMLLSQDSVKNTAHRMFAKLGARDRAHAVAIALRDGLLS